MTPPTSAGSEDQASIPLSALEHYAYCPRQSGLIHIEGIWAENIDTVRGDLAHHTVDLPGTTTRHGTTTIRSLPVYSDVHGLHGICDLVEITGRTAIPVEYKISRYRTGSPAEIQLAGQAICLREAGYTVDHGYIYSTSQRRRHHVDITPELVARAITAATAIRRLLASQQLPPAVNDQRCRRCSLKEECLPELTQHPTTTIDLFRARPEGTWRD
ncbi:CRISPR-associated protein Cas4 [Phytomonospora sp. NPDC050363]|uniref:CRISPR-associated protein Cas4 n=1 Tax=Phytomonospora sp. NPDC050363 TaxID=3155642 RepID=UPI0033E83838